MTFGKNTKKYREAKEKFVVRPDSDLPNPFCKTLRPWGRQICQNLQTNQN
jgi:hypothetical protein